MIRYKKCIYCGKLFFNRLWDCATCSKECSKKIVKRNGKRTKNFQKEKLKNWYLSRCKKTLLEKNVKKEMTSNVKSLIKTNRRIPVYDIIGLPNHNFIANGIIVHNCEQTIQRLGRVLRKKEKESTLYQLFCIQTMEEEQAYERAKLFKKLTSDYREWIYDGEELQK